MTVTESNSNLNPQPENPIWSELLDRYQNDPSTDQLIFVRHTTGSSAAVSMYAKTADAWENILNCSAHIGKNGLGKQCEGDCKTPVGVYDIISAYGIRPNPGTKLPYIQVTPSLYWCDDQAHYNKLVDLSVTPGPVTGEHLSDYDPEYNYGMFLNYNPECIYPKGSAIFFHCTGRNPYTAGCIAVEEPHMITILQHAQPGIKICIYPQMQQ